jgi:hypothetical protein
MPTDPCQPIRDLIATVEEEIVSLQDILNEVPPGLKPLIQANIRREKIHLTQLKRALKACEEAHKRKGA